MNNYQNRYYALLIELGEKTHEMTKMQWELDYLNGVGKTSTDHAVMLINKAINKLHDDIYLQGDVEEAKDALWQARKLVNALSYGDFAESIDEDMTDD